MSLKTFFAFLLFLSLCFTQKYDLYSPDSTVSINIVISKKFLFSVNKNRIEILKLSEIDIDETSASSVFRDKTVINVSHQYIDKTLRPVVKIKTEFVKDHYNQLIINFKLFSLELRAYNEGFAYRLIAKSNDKLIINNEGIDLWFPDSSTVYFPEEKSFHSHNERSYQTLKIEKIQRKKFCSLPMLSVSNGFNIVVTESDLNNYAGMWLEKKNKNEFKGIFPKYPKKTIMEKDRHEKITETEKYIVKTKAKRTFPWRIFIISENDKKLLTNQLSWILSGKNKLHDYDWIKPGKVAWDWWNFNNIYGVDFKAGINTKTYKYYIDFAAQYGIEYIIMDEGWYKLGNLFEVVPEIDIKELMRYAKSKNVGIILWVIWKTLDEQLEQALKTFKNWGVKGIKVDFMQRDDQWMVNYYERIAKAAAKYKLLVDFHGSYKPSGLHRQYPNVMTYEGVRGLEHNKWAGYINPDHDLTIPFIRMLAGPMDYTPGAMRNASKGNHAIIFNNPMSKGTRVHQLSMYVIYESPLQMLADNPTSYQKEKEIMEFLGPVPTVWDETIVIKAKISDYIIMARRHAKDWYIAGMNDWNPREFKIDLDFLKTGKKYKALIFKDGANADRNGVDYIKELQTLTSRSNLLMKMSAGGGWVARLVEITK